MSKIAVSLFVRLWVEISVTLHEGLTKIVSLFVRLWVEMSIVLLYFFKFFVSLFVRLWVEMDGRWYEQKMGRRQPLREAVSWNTNVCRRLYPWRGQPLREAVSWNTRRCVLSMRASKSASSWGCELKFFVNVNIDYLSSQPLREAVSWNTCA